MPLQRFAVHPTCGFVFAGCVPSPVEQESIHDICVTIATAFFQGQIKAKKISLTQFCFRGRYDSVQVLVLGEANVVDKIGPVIRLSKNTENAGLADRSTVAWLHIGSDNNKSTGSYFMIRSDMDLLDRVNQFFAPFIEEVKELVPA